MQKILPSLMLSAALVVGIQATANAQMKTSKPSQTVYGTTATENNTLGVGYKLGNGLDFVGADLIYNPLPNLSLDLQIASLPGRVGFAPQVQYHLDPLNGPYVGVGYLASTFSGVFGNVGWNLRPFPNVGVQAGVGYQRLIGAPDGLNYEAGVRYFFM